MDTYFVLTIYKLPSIQVLYDVTTHRCLCDQLLMKKGLLHRNIRRLAHHTHLLLPILGKDVVLDYAFCHIRGIYLYSIPYLLCATCLGDLYSQDAIFFVSPLYYSCFRDAMLSLAFLYGPCFSGAIWQCWSFFVRDICRISSCNSTR